jgi:hypothetical protein
MRFAPVYWNDAEPVGETLDRLLYRLRQADAEDGLIFDSVTIDDLMELAEEGQILLDALVTTRLLLDRKMTAIERVMNAASRTLDVTASQVSDPFKRQGVINVAAVFELSDGQTITVVFHNPDAKNVKALKPGDDLISWKWMLNKRDVTIVVAPEKGTDLPIRQVARRLMLLAEKNSRAFQRLNQKRAERLENIEGLKTEIKQLEIEYGGLLKRIEVAKLEADERAVNPKPVVEPEPVIDPATEPTPEPEPAVEPTSIPDSVKQELMRPFQTLIDGLERGRSTDRQFNGGGRYAAEVWLDMDMDNALRQADERVAARVAEIPDERNRAAAQAYVDANRPDFSLTTDEQEWLDSFKRKRSGEHEPTPEPLTQGPLPWDNQTRDDESNARWFGTKVKMTSLDRKSADSGLQWEGVGRLQRTLNDGKVIEVIPEGKDSSLRFSAADYVIEVLELVDNNPGPGPTGETDPDPATLNLPSLPKLGPEAIAPDGTENAVLDTPDWKAIADAFGSQRPRYAGTRESGPMTDEWVDSIASLPAGSWVLTYDGFRYGAFFSTGDGGFGGGDTKDTPQDAYESMLKASTYQRLDLDGGLRPDGAENTVKTAKGTQIATGFTVVEADTLIVSHDNQGNPNPDYPAELQPRDRGRETSIAWIRKTANQLDPDSLGKTRRADTGAPIVGPDRVVESGNGRTMAIQEAYRTGKADEYRDWLIEEAESFGLNPNRIRAMKRPVLVRVRTSDIDRRTFAIEANQDDKLAMTATEKARSDADRLDEALLSKLADDGDLLSAANRDFIRGFLAALGDAEAAQYITTDGQPTAALIARVQAAVFAKAYSDDRLLELTADASKPEIANILNALNAAALEFIRAQAAAKGATDVLTSEIADSVETSLNAQAVQAIIDATNLVRKARSEGQSVEEVVNQRGLFDDIPPATAAMALFIHKNNRSAKRMATAFRAMARHVRQEAERGQTVDLFGDLKPATLEDIIGAANRELEREYGEGQFAIETLDLFGQTKSSELELSPIARLNDMLLRGDIGAAVDFLGTLKNDDLKEVLLKNGFTIAFGSANDILKSVQQDLIRAANLKTDGFGLAALDEPKPDPEPTPEPQPASAIMPEQAFDPINQGQVPEDLKDDDRAFLQSVIDGHADFYDATITDRLASIAESRADDPEIAPLIQQAKTAAKNWFVAEFKRKTEGMAV